MRSLDVAFTLSLLLAEGVKLMANKEKAWPEAEFRHKTEKGPDGEITYAYPVEVGSKLEGYDKETLEFFKISKNDCHSIRYTETDVVYVHYIMVKEKDVAQDQWAYLNSRHSREYAHDRCMVPGVRKDYILCPDTRSCKNCPHQANRQKRIISLDKFAEDGYDVGSGLSSEDAAMKNIEREELYAIMRSEDPRIAEAYRLRTEKNYTPKEISGILGVSQPRIYQLLARAKKIVYEYYSD